ncbi:MAG TPA: PEP-CTERM sorting domain-containing protein [Rhizomicrobium sp.]|jgi:hypothetical protein
MTCRWIVIASVALLAATPALATSLSQNNFNLENGGVYAIDYTGFQNFNVSAGSVDLIGGGNFDFNNNMNLYVDMAGSTNQYGALTTNATFGAGTYEISLDVGGSIYAGIGDGVSMSWLAGSATCLQNCSVTGNSISTGLIAGLQEEIVKFDVTLTGNSTFTIADLGLSGDPDVGATLFGVDIAMPEPASLGLLGSGLVAAGWFGRRRKRKPVA